MHKRLTYKPQFLLKKKRFYSHLNRLQPQLTYYSIQATNH